MAITQRLFETLRYRLASDSGLTTPADSSTTTTGTVTAGDDALTLASATSFSVGHGILATGAGTGGDDLTTWITAVDGSVATMHDKAVTGITAQAISHDDRFCVLPAQIKPAYGNKPVAFPCITLRLEVALRPGFPDATEGQVFIYIYTQSEPVGTGQPLERTNMITDRINALYHRKESSISNAAIRIQLLVEDFKSGVMAEPEISETTHFQHLRYEVKANLA